MTKRTLLAATFLLSASTAFAAPLEAKFSLNGSAIDTLVGSSGRTEVPAKDLLNLKYTGAGTFCTNVEWQIKPAGDTEWTNFDSTKAARLQLFRAGDHQLRMTVEGYDNWLALCFRKGQSAEKTVTLHVDTPAYTQTRYPILIVPGVLGYDAINLLLMQAEYFYGIPAAINQDSDQLVVNVPLNPWQDTIPRGEALAEYILTFLVNHQMEDGKVNLLAHSHGSTTSRIALSRLAEQFGENGKVASLTTVAGPHYGTPTADGANIALQEWGWQGDLLEMTLVPGFELLGDAIALFAGNPEYIGQGDLLSVLTDFTQDEMYRFNRDFPTVALPPNGKYQLRDVVDPAVDTDDPKQAYGAGLYEDYIASAAVSHDILQSNGSIVTQSLVVGNGLGQPRPADATDAIQFYSLTGNAPWSTNWMDPADYILYIFNSFYGVAYENRLGVPSAEEYIESDSFVPTSSAHFGKFLGAYYWNHVDEQNGLFGLLPGIDPQGNPVPNPKDVYRTHANRLQRAGL
jgi:triacylglycerol lipase